MTVKECAAIAARFVRENETRHPGYIGAYVGGSTAAMPPGAQIAGGSDMDVYVVCEAPPPSKRGKFEYLGALIEVSYVAAADIFPAEKALGDYHLANSLRYRFVLDDPRGALCALEKKVARDFAQLSNIIRRRDHALDRVRAGLMHIDYDAPLPDLTLSWLFPTGITTHAVLVSALRNPTIRLRYLRAREVMLENGLAREYEMLLEISGFERVTRAQAQALMDALEPIYDRAAAVQRTPFSFGSDISAQSRPAAIDALRTLSASGRQREVMFWIMATYARAMKILLVDDPESYFKYLECFEGALALVGRRDNAAIGSQAGKVLAYLPKLGLITDRLAQKSANAARRAAGEEEGELPITSIDEG